MSESKFDILSHGLVPKHKKLSEDEVKKILQEYHISKIQLPMISLSDPVIERLGAKEGDVIRITRKSVTQDEKYFRRVIK